MGQASKLLMCFWKGHPFWKRVNIYPAWSQYPEEY